jgi:hypothetical protein
VNFPPKSQIPSIFPARIFSQHYATGLERPRDDKSPPPEVQGLKKTLGGGNGEGKDGRGQDDRSPNNFDKFTPRGEGWDGEDRRNGVLIGWGGQNEM